MIDQLMSIWLLIEPNINWIGMFMGLLGQGVIIFPTYRAKVKGFEIWIYSNVSWIIWGYITNDLPLMIMNSGYTLCNIAGIWTHWEKAENERKIQEDLLKIPDRKS